MINSLFELISADFAQAVFYAILNSLIAGIIIFSALKLIFGFIQFRNPAVKYWISYFAFCSIFVITIISFANSLDNTAFSSIEVNGGYLIFNHDNTNYHDSDVVNFIRSQYEYLLTILFTYHKYISIFWICGFIISIIRLLNSYIRLNKFTSKNFSSFNRNLTNITKKVLTTLELNRKVIVYQCSHLTTPIIYGVLKPTILFPIRLLSNLNDEQIELIIIHELAHLKRFDPLFKLMQSLIDSLLFFNPFVWIISKEIDIEREKCCDDLVKKHSQNEILYARTLLNLAEDSYYLNNAALGLNGNENQLLSRIKRLMEPAKENFKYRERLYTNFYLSILLSTLITFSMISSLKTNFVSTNIEPISTIEDVLNLLSKDVHVTELDLHKHQSKINSKERNGELPNLLNRLSRSEFYFNNPFEVEHIDLKRDINLDFRNTQNEFLHEKLVKLEKRMDEFRSKLKELNTNFK